MRRPILLLAVAFGLGVTLGNDLSRGDAPPLLGLAAALLLLAWWAAPRAALAAVVGSALALGAASLAIERTQYARSRLGAWVASAPTREPVEVTGTAAADAWATQDDWWLLLDVESVRSRGREMPFEGVVKIRVGGRASHPEVIQGDRLSVWATLHRPRGSGDAAADDSIERAFRNGIQAFGYCKSPLVVRLRPPVDPRSLLERLAQVRARMRHALTRWIPAGPELDVTRAMVLGDKAGLDERTAEAFRIAGTYHVLALSGAQIALVGVLLLAPLRRARLPPSAQALIVTVGLATYALLVGGDVPVARAALMASLLLGGRALELDGDGTNLLGLAALVLLVWRPSTLGDPGFQLSFAATLGLLALSRPVERLLRLPTLPFRCDLALAVSVAAQLALVPLLARLFHRLAPAALLLNLLAVPLSSAVLLLGWGVVLASIVGGPLAQASGILAWAAAHALVLSGEAVRLIPALDARLPTPSPGAVLVYVVGLALLASGRRDRVAVAVVAVGLAGIVAGSPTAGPDGRLHLDVVDVGQGDCLVLRSPAGRVVVVDAGGGFSRPFDFGETIVGPHLWDQGVRSIAHVVVSHAHPDHVGGVPFLLGAFDVADLWEGPAPSADPIYRELERRARLSGVARRTVIRGLSARFDGARIEVLWPPRLPRPSLRTRNDQSVVLRVSLGRRSFLLTGDIESSAEAALADPRADVLKVPHHGSRTSSSATFLARVGPAMAVVSVGYRNSFGHPHPEVVARYGAAGARLYRTDVDGTVRLATDGRHVWIETDRSGLRERMD